MRLTKLSTTGLKAHNHALTLSDVTLLVGANGSGKSEAVQAISLLATGEAPGVGKTNDAIMRLARDGGEVGAALEVRGTFDDRTRAARRWERVAVTKKGEVTNKVTESATLAGPGQPPSEDAGPAIRLRFGAWSESWRPDDLLGLSADKLRRRLIVLLGGIGGAIPAELTAQVPQHDDEDEEEWLTRARGVLADRTTLARAEVRRIESLVASHGFEPASDKAPVQARLATLRAEVGDAQVLADLRRELADAEALAHATPTEGLALADAQAARDAAEATLTRVRTAWDSYDSRRRAAESLLTEASRRVAAVAAEVRSLQRKGAAELVDLADLADAEDALARVEADDAAALSTRRAAVGRLDAARARVTVLAAGSPIALCPACHADLGAALAEARAVADQYARDAETACLEAEQAATTSGARVREARAALERARLGSLAREAMASGWVAVMAEAWDRFDLDEILPPAESLTAAESAVLETRAAVANAEGRRWLEEQARAAAGQVAALRSRINTIPPTRAIAEVEDEIRRAEAELVAIGAQLERRAQVEDERGQLVDAGRILTEAQERETRLAAYERSILDGVRDRLEAPLSEAVGAPVTIELTNARGDPTCRIHRGGVDVASISTGERLRFVAALLVVLGRTSQAAWRPVILDGLESIDEDNLGPFLAQMVAAQREGAIHQFLGAGCMARVPNVEGVTVIRLGASAPSTTAQAAA